MNLSSFQKQKKSNIFFTTIKQKPTIKSYLTEARRNNINPKQNYFTEIAKQVNISEKEKMVKLASSMISRKTTKQDTSNYKIYDPTAVKPKPILVSPKPQWTLTYGINQSFVKKNQNSYFYSPNSESQLKSGQTTSRNQKFQEQQKSQIQSPNRSIQQKSRIQSPNRSRQISQEKSQEKNQQKQQSQMQEQFSQKLKGKGMRFTKNYFKKRSYKKKSTQEAVQESMDRSYSRLMRASARDKAKEETRNFLAAIETNHAKIKGNYQKQMMLTEHQKILLSQQIQNSQIQELSGFNVQVAKPIEYREKLYLKLLNQEKQKTSKPTPCLSYQAYPSISRQTNMKKLIR